LVHERTEWAELLCAFGELDISLAGQLQSAITRHLNGRLPLVLDLQFCEYLDSTILRVLVRAFRTAPQRFCLVVPEAARIARIFAMTRLDQTLGVAKSRDEVRERLSA
jgi:anti-anti-sigma factor